MTPSRHFVTVGARRVHYTRSGSGTPVLLLHASATSSGEMAVPQAVFARDFTAIAFDTPGYGLSEPLGIDRQPEIEDYADALADTVAALGIGPAAVYGRHTGASIAVEFARRHPGRCSMVLTDGYPIWTEEERARMLGGYLPALEPSWDGAHLLWSWFRYRDQHAFWPWFDWRAAARATRDLPSLAFIHRGALEFLLAGDGYRVGYSAAFRHDGGAALAGLQVPVCLGTRPSDLIHAMRDRAPADAWRAVLPTDPLAAAVAERGLLHRSPGASPVPPAPACLALPGRSTPDFIEAAGCRLMMRRTAGSGEPMLVIPEIPGGSAPMTPVLEALPGPAIAFDLPGLAESDMPDGFTLSVENWAGVLLAALDRLGLSRVRVHAHRGGCAVAAALALAAPDRVSALVLDCPLLVPDAARAQYAEDYAPNASICWDGSHLLRVWHHLRDQEFWFPYYDRRQATALATDPDVDAARLTLRAIACLRQPANYRAAWRAVWSYDLASALTRLTVPASITATSNDAFSHLAPAAAALVVR